MMQFSEELYNMRGNKKVQPMKNNQDPRLS